MFATRICSSHRAIFSMVSVCARTPTCTSKRTFFNFWKKKKPKVDPKDVTYSIVTPAAVSPRRIIPDLIGQPEYAESGVPSMPSIYPILADKLDIERMKAAGQLARNILNMAGKEVKPGITTDHIDEVVHEACINHKAYPSPLNYKGFPKSVCTSVNNVVVHGIPDSRPLQDGDIINIDVTVYLNGYHGDVAETFLVGSVNETGRRLVDTARLCRDRAIQVCSHDTKISEIGNTIMKIAEEAGFVVCPIYIGHGIGKHFHCKPDIWTYANNYPEKMLEGMIFTVEPVILEYPDRVIEDQNDGWTVHAENYARSAQFEHTVLITHTGVEILTADDEEDANLCKNTIKMNDRMAVNSTITDETQDWKFKT